MTTDDEVEINPYSYNLFYQSFDEVIELYDPSEELKQIHVRAYPQVFERVVMGLLYDYNISKRKAYSCAIKSGMSSIYHEKKINTLVRHTCNKGRNLSSFEFEGILSMRYTYCTIIYYKISEQLKVTLKDYDIITSNSKYLGLSPAQFALNCFLIGAASAKKLKLQDIYRSELEKEITQFKEYIDYRYNIINSLL